jgi:membrane-associated phospholipid phosphatase
MPFARALAAFLLLATAGAGYAQPRELEYHPAASVPLTVAAIGVWWGAELLKPRLAPAACLTCEVNGFDRSARLLLVADDVGPAARASDILAYAVLPLAAGASAIANARGAGQGWNEGFGDLLVVTEAVALAGAVNQVTKFAVGRTRPFVRFGNYADPDRAPHPDDALSFYGGHTSFAFSITTSTAMVATLRHDPSAPWLWGGGLLVAGTVGYLRIASDNHYLSEVLVGAVAGTAFGVGIPWLFHRPPGAGASGAPPAGVVTPYPVALAFAF